MSQGMFGDGSNRKSRNEEADLDITPMIDVTFLLLIFFMVTSTMQATPKVKLPVAHHGVGINKAEQVTITVLNEGGIPAIFSGDPPAPQMSIEEIVAYTKEQIDDGKSGILVKADGDIPTGFIKQLTQQLQSVGVVQFHYAVSEQTQ